MDNSTALLDNITAANLPDNSSLDYSELPGFVAYNIIMLIVVLLPVVAADVFLLAALYLDRDTPVQLKVVIANLLLGALCVAFSLTLNHLSSVILAKTDAPVPPSAFCHLMVWVMAGGGAARMAFTSVFSVVVLVMIRSGPGASAAQKAGLCVCCVVLWAVAFALSAPLLTPVIVGSQFLGGAACFPKNTEAAFSIGLTGAYVAFWAIAFGVIPLAVTFVVLIAAAMYIYSKNFGGNVDFQKALVKFNFYLILVILSNFIGQVLPPILAVIVSRIVQDSPLLYYIGLTLMNVSLIPTPILILIYLGGVRERAKDLFLCYCIHDKNDASLSPASRLYNVYKRHNSMRRRSGVRV